MGPNMYLYEKAREVHYQDLRREAEKERLLAQLRAAGIEPRSDSRSRWHRQHHTTDRPLAHSIFGAERP